MAGRGTKTVAFWGLRAIVVAAALAAALAVPVVPALQAVVGSEGWARAAEAFLLVFFFRAALVLLAIREGSFTFLGVSLEDAAPVTSEAAARAVEKRLLVRIGWITEETDAAAERIGRLEARVDVIEETLFGGG
jgi:hypothetical protein